MVYWSVTNNQTWLGMYDPSCRVIVVTADPLKYPHRHAGCLFAALEVDMRLAYPNPCSSGCGPHIVGPAVSRVIGWRYADKAASGTAYIYYAQYALKRPLASSLRRDS